MNEIMNINGVECYEKDGVTYLKLEAVSRGLGFVQIKNGAEYVKWERVEGYLKELHFSPQVGKDGFIPENIFYRLAMKAENAAAKVFQAKTADEVIPAIRRHGAYMTPATIEKILTDPDTIIRLATSLKQEREKRQALEAENPIMRPKALFADSVAAFQNSILVGELAEFLKQNGVDIGQNRLFAWLRSDPAEGLRLQPPDAEIYGNGAL